MAAKYYRRPPGVLAAWIATLIMVKEFGSAPLASFFRTDLTTRT